MTRTHFARRLVQFASMFALATILASACGSATAPRFPEDPKEDEEDPGEG